MWYVCDVLYAVLYVCVSCFVVRGCAVSRRYIYVCYGGWGVGGVGGGASWARVWEGRLVLCLCVLCCESGLFVLMAGPGIYIYIVLGGYLRILGAPSVQSCCTPSISAS